MHRLGFMPEDVESLTKLLLETPTIKIQSGFSHLAASSDAALDNFSRQQIETFRSITDDLKQALGYEFIRHIGNTSAISRLEEAQFDMVRLGIGLYGVDSSYRDLSPLETVATLRTSISQIKEIKPGETVGYGRRGVMPKGGTVATVKIGYADGYNRKLGNGAGKMLVNGKAVSTIGDICMDMCMLDITGINASEGDELIVFNNQITVQDLAETLETIPYEILTGISERVKRVYYYE